MERTTEKAPPCSTQNTERMDALRTVVRGAMAETLSNGPDATEHLSRALRAAVILQRGEARMPSRRAAAALQGICKLADWRKGRMRFLSGPYGASHGHRKSAGEDARALAAALNFHRGGGSLWSAHVWEANRAGSLASRADTVALVFLALRGTGSNAAKAWHRALYGS